MVVWRTDNLTCHFNQRNLCISVIWLNPSQQRCFKRLSQPCQKVSWHAWQTFYQWQLHCRNLQERWITRSSKQSYLMGIKPLLECCIKFAVAVCVHMCSLKDKRSDLWCVRYFFYHLIWAGNGWWLLVAASWLKCLKCVYVITPIYIIHLLLSLGILASVE